MHHKFDTLLQAGLLEVPDDFTECVMRAVEHMPLPTLSSLTVALAPPSDRQSLYWISRLQWLALLGGTVAGVLQVMGFILSIWTATTAF